MNRPKPPVSPSDAVLSLSPAGYLRHWLVTRTNETAYVGPPGPEHVLRKEALDPRSGAPPGAGELHRPGPFGDRWRFHDPGANEFVEFSTFYQSLTVVETFASTLLETERGGDRPALFWAAGVADLWVNGVHTTRLEVTRYRNPDCASVVVPLRPGANHLVVRLQCLGIRDTRMLFGLRFSDRDGLRVRFPNGGSLAAAAEWIDGVRWGRDDRLTSSAPAPREARIQVAGREFAWPAGAASVDLSPPSDGWIGVRIETDGVRLERKKERPSVRPVPPPGDAGRRERHLLFIARAGVGGEPPAAWNAAILPVIARRLLGSECPEDVGAFAAAVAMVDARRDCADFLLAGLLRLELLGLSTPAESAEIRRAALAFRYWTDEPGTDAMCFHSENHSLLFHGCQLLAGQLYPDDRFACSGRTGRDHQAAALPRILRWIEQVEERKFEEFNSSTYMPITVAAMLNVVDFCADREVAGRMAVQIDWIYRTLARHVFDGGVISPQGRVYRDVLIPEDSGTQALLSLAAPLPGIDPGRPRPADGRTGDWIVFPASSPRYQPPADLMEWAVGSHSETYRSADVEVVLEKTPAFVLTSLAVPAVPRPGEHPVNDLRPGGAGYQQHLWQATLGRDCHVFVNHPGGFYDGTPSRPGYWHGNGLLPRVRQEGRWLQAIHVIPDGSHTRPPITPDVWQWGSPSTVRPYDRYPIEFVHAHWPSDRFDEESREERWVFGRRGRGMIGLWCSEDLRSHDDVLTGRELRALGLVSAWVAVCGDTAVQGSFETFRAECLALDPEFDRSALVLSLRGVTPTRWWERSEPMPG